MRFSGNVLRFNKDEWSRPVSLEEFAFAFARVFVIYRLFVFCAKSCERAKLALRPVSRQLTSANF